MNHDYKLRKEDFIPMIGLIKHHKRCVSEMYRNKLAGEEYAAQAWGRDAVLSLYNSALLIGTLTGIAFGLEAIFK